MPKVIIPSDYSLISDSSEELKEDFMLQDEQEILQCILADLNALIREPQKSTIEKILQHASLF